MTELQFRRARNIADGLCMFAAKHGPATNGKRCAECAKSRQTAKGKERLERIADGVCAVARSHGNAVRGQVCQECYEREQAAHARIRAKKKKPTPLP